MFGRILIGVVRSYQLLISSWTLPSCRFAPSCSAYAIEAIEKHGAWRGGWLALRRITRCHPWGGHGYDPVPIGRPEDGNGGRAETGHGSADKVPASRAGRV
ncbi:MAG: membrane protein insertion efficiency factor YidD [Gemmatimonadota bacterium]|nr:membrane protein insertion efficiency factor YidD [Gemmatimonadota bacterium]